MSQPGHLPDNPVTAPDLAATPVKVRCRPPGPSFRIRRFTLAT
jgi:hypothetical protein